MTDKLTYKDIIDRCNRAALEITPALPTEDNLGIWQAFYDDLDALRDESNDLVWEEVDSWDWCIYTHYGMQIVDVISSQELNAAEESFLDCGGLDSLDSSNFGVYEIAHKVAFHALVNLMTEALESVIDDLQELAATKIEQLESEGK